VPRKFRLLKSQPVYIAALVCLYLISPVFRLIPRAVRNGFFTILAMCFYLVDRPNRRLAVFNLKYALGCSAGKANAIFRTSYIYRVWHLADVFFWGRIERQKAQELLGKESFERLVRALSAEQGLVVVTAHYGAETLLCYAIAALQKASCIARRQRVFGNLMRRHRARHGLETLIDREIGYSDILQRLRRGEVVLLTLDQALRRKGVWVRFLGKPAHTPYFPADLARLSGAPIFVAFMFYQRRKYRFVLHGPRLVPSDADIIQSRYEVTQWINDIISAQVRALPHHWLWATRRFRCDIAIDRYPHITTKTFPQLTDPYSSARLA